MVSMRLQQQLSAEEIEWRELDHGDRTELVADFEPNGRCSVDVVDDTVIVVAGGEQYEFDAPGGTNAVMHNGVLTLEVEQ